VERQARDPILPFPLFRDRIFAIACSQGVLAGGALFGSVSFVPLFVQAVLGTSATAAGVTLTPMTLGWTFASILGSQFLLRCSYRTLAVTGMGLLTLGAGLMSRALCAKSRYDPAAMTQEGKSLRHTLKGGTLWLMNIYCLNRTPASPP
jgi:hypothetical protein